MLKNVTWRGLEVKLSTTIETLTEQEDLKSEDSCSVLIQVLRIKWLFVEKLQHLVSSTDDVCYIGSGFVLV